MKRSRPFLRAHRPLPRRPGPYTEAEIRAAEIRAVRVELDRRPLAEDVGRNIIRGRFGRDLIATAAVGA